MSEPKKKVLVIVYDFPPLGGGGVMRVHKFARYLPEFGWEPIILTVDEDYYGHGLSDPGLMAELPDDITIIRTRCLRPRRKPQAGAQRTTLPAQAGRPRSLRSRMWRWMGRRFFVKHDSRILWHPYALCALRRIMRDHKIDLIFTSSPPHSVHLLGVLARRLYAKPWVADFRDGWTDDVLFQAKSPARLRWDRMVERQVISSADHVITATAAISGWFRERYHDLFGLKSTMLYNGFDPADFSDCPSDGTDNGAASMEILFAGSLGSAVSVSPLLRAYTALIESGEIPANGMRIRFVGSMPPGDRRLAENTAGVEVEGFIPHSSAIEQMCAADVLLVVNAVGPRDALTGKVFEYMRTGRPILALTYEGALSRLVREQGLGVVAPPDDQKVIEQVLLDLYDQFRQGSLSHYGARAELLDQYNRRKNCGKLAAVFDRLVSQG